MVTTAKKRGKKVIKVNLMLQVLEAFEGTDRIFKFDCVTGDKDHPTDRGTFLISRKSKHHVSEKYKVKMHFAMFFTDDGKAIHQYHGFAPLNMVRAAKGASDWFGSHGCIRLTENDARALFAWTPEMTKVVVS